MCLKHSDPYQTTAGNVLFIILIAVALFAALAYAVTQSIRGGGSGADNEANLVDSSVLQQFTAGIRGAVTRMTVNGVAQTDLEFNPPSDFSGLSSPAVGIFHPAGGTIIYEIAGPDVMNQSGPNPMGRWIFTMSFEVKNIVTNAAGSSDGNDILAVLVGVKPAICEKINTKLGLPISPFPSVTGVAYSTDLLNDPTNYMDNSYVVPSSESVIGGGASDSDLAGTYEGCYQETVSGNYVYYSVISGR